MMMISKDSATCVSAISARSRLIQVQRRRTGQITHRACQIARKAGPTVRTALDDPLLADVGPNALFAGLDRVPVQVDGSADAPVCQRFHPHPADGVHFVHQIIVQRDLLFERDGRTGPGLKLHPGREKRALLLDRQFHGNRVEPARGEITNFGFCDRGHCCTTTRTYSSSPVHTTIITGFSIRALNAPSSTAPSAPSTARWSVASPTVMTCAASILPSRTTARSSPAPTERIVACGGLMMA